MTKLFSIAALLAVAAEAKMYEAGEVRTVDQTFKYGRFITRMKGDNKPGSLYSFFTYFEGDASDPFTRAKWNEIDVEIAPSVTANPFFTNIIAPNRVTNPYYHPNFDPATDWHTYTIDWTPEYIAWFLNGQEVRRDTGTKSVREMTKRQYLYMNFWTPEFSPWMDNRDDSDMPWYVRYDYVEFQSYNTSTKKFTYEWRDDFNSFDETRWRKSNGWSYDGNSSTFEKKNVYIENGALVLRMGKTGQVYPTPAPAPAPTPEPTPTPTPTPTPAPVTDDNTEYVYQKPCPGSMDRSLCADCLDGQECFRSWAYDDELKHKSPDAACRCLPRQRQADGYKYSKNTQSNKTKGTCDGCEECATSIPKDDPLGWDSAEKMARCRAPAAQELTIAGACDNVYKGECGADCYSCVWSWPTAEGNGPNSKCRCETDQIIETIWGEPCGRYGGDCGRDCADCVWSWKVGDPKGAGSKDATCRCRNWKKN